MTARRERGLTLIELLIGVAVATILVLVVAPNFRDYIVLQRLKSVHAQLVTDLQFARAEAVALNRYVRFSQGSNASMSCYTIYTSDSNATRCDCTLGVGAACTGTMREIRTVQVPASESVRLSVPAGQDSTFAFDHVTGGIVSIPINLIWPPPLPYEISASIDTARTLRTTVGMSGRPTTCSPGGPLVGAPAC